MVDSTMREKEGKLWNEKMGEITDVQFGVIGLNQLLDLWR